MDIETTSCLGINQFRNIKVWYVFCFHLSPFERYGCWKMLRRDLSMSKPVQNLRWFLLVHFDWLRCHFEPYGWYIDVEKTSELWSVNHPVQNWFLSVCLIGSPFVNHHHYHHCFVLISSQIMSFQKNSFSAKVIIS